MGASKGVGKAIAMLLASEGAAVVMVARSEGELRAAAEEVTQAGGKAIAHAADVADPEAMAAAVHAAREELGGLDALVNNAGTGGKGRVEDLALEEWRRVLETNLTGAFVCSNTLSF